MDTGKAKDRRQKSTVFLVVRVTGLEPAWSNPQEPKSCVSANSTTPAYGPENRAVVLYRKSGGLARGQSFNTPWSNID